MSEQNKALMRRGIEEVWNGGNFDVVDDLIASDFVGHQLPEKTHGPAGVKRYFAMLREAFPDIHFTIEDQIAEGDRVATRWTARATHTGPFKGIPPTGKPGVVTGITINRVANNKVVEGWTNLDELGMLQQLVASVDPILSQGATTSGSAGPVASRGPRQELSSHPGFVGSWLVTFFEEDGPPTLALATFGADGTVVTAEHPVVTPPIAPGAIFTSSGHGAWEPTSEDSAIFTVVGLGSYAQGILFGTATGRSTITLGADRQTCSGDMVWTIADPTGNPLATFPGTFQATRIRAEPPGVR